MGTNARATPRSQRILGVALVFLALYTAASLLTAHLDGARGPLADAYANAGGWLGTRLAGLLLAGPGWILALLVPGLLAAWGWNRLRDREVPSLAWRSALLVLAALVLSTLSGLLSAPFPSGVRAALAGGLGIAIAGGLASLLGVWGGLLLLFASLVILGLLLAEPLVVSTGRAAWFGLVVLPARGLGALVSRASGRGAGRPSSRTRIVRAGDPAAAPAGGAAGAAAKGRHATRVDPGPAALGKEGARRKEASPAAARPDRETAGAAGRPGAVSPPRIVSEPPPRFAEENLALPLGGSGEPGELPPVHLLEMPENAARAVGEDELLENSRLLEATLLDFGVRGKVGEVHPGPVITRFEFEPAPGVKVNQILNREDDLALALRASRIRIVAPIPGKAAVGIEIPNRSPQTVYLKEIVASPAFRDTKAPLPLALGKEISGEAYATDLTKMPHLLIAGTTGSGKSVCVNSILTSLLLTRRPEEMRLLMVDPKMLELTVYNGIPHLLAPVITDSKQAGRYLRWLISEMERRYRLLAGRAVRNIQGYNDALAKEKKEGSEEPLQPLPYIVLVIDELADLMTTSSQEVEEPIGRLAQTARAVGIHLLLATQRPSVDVITGVIKANFPTRIAFQVASRTDSRTILDMNGAESLLGKGDMLFLPPGLPAPIRVHGAFVSDQETERIVSFLRRQKSPTPAVVLDDEPEGGGRPGHDDPLFEEAKRLVVLHQQGSTSLLQRRLKIGYSHAARLMDMLEASGVVGPQMGSKAREVLLDEAALGERESV